MAGLKSGCRGNDARLHIGTPLILDVDKRIIISFQRHTHIQRTQLTILTERQPICGVMGC